MGALVCAAAIIAAGCHKNHLTSGFGITWVTLSDTPGDFTSYTVNVDSVTLTGKVVGTVTVVGAVETVDFTKLKNVSELWSAASVPNDTFTAASIVLDYTNANISVMVNGVPTKANVVDTTGKAVTTQTINVTLDSANPLVIQPTYASTSAVRLAIDLNLPASNVTNMSTSPPTVTIKPFMTVATSPPDTKPVRVRGPLINSSVDIGTYTVYLRPFFDEINNLGSLTIFNDASTVYTVNGTTYVGAAGLKALSQTSAGTTITAAYTTYEPTATLNASVTAGKFNADFILAGSTLEDFYTLGLEGDVIKRSGNTLTLRGSTLQFNSGLSQYNNTDAVVFVGPKTIVTADDNTTLTGLNDTSVAVGQHIIARGSYTLPASGVVTLDATASSATTGGSVRIVSTELWGPLVSSASGSLVLDLQTINNWPIGNYTFTGNGPGAVMPAGYLVNTGSLALPAGLVAPDPVWIDGLVAPFGSAPPDFNASAINAESSVQATLRVDWTSAGTTTPFATLTNSGLTIDLNDANYGAGVIRVGSESIDLKSLPPTTIVPQPGKPAGSGLPYLMLPSFAIGNLSAANTTSITVFNSFASFVSRLPTSLVAATPALHFVATGLYNRGNNSFSASSIDVVN
jgi:hypothetical protein